MDNSAPIQDSSNNKRILLNSKDALLTFIVVALFVLELAGGFYGASRMSKIKCESDNLRTETIKLRSDNDQLKQENEDLVKQKDNLQSKIDILIAADKNNDLRLKGIDPSIQDIKTLSLGITWKDGTYSYEIRNVYYTPIIADYSFVKVNSEFKGKSFLMFEINITDNRIVGDSQAVPISSYLTLKSGEKIIAPFSEDYLFLSPHERKTMYTGFAVESSSTVFSLLAGSAVSPQYIDVDFGKTSGVKTLKGVFMLKTGYAPAYAEY